MSTSSETSLDDLYRQTAIVSWYTKTDPYCRAIPTCERQFKERFNACELQSERGRKDIDI